MSDVIDFKSYNISYLDEKGDNGFMMITIYALDKNSNPVLVRVEDFSVYFYLELPTLVGNISYKWNKMSAYGLCEAIRARFRNEDGPLMFHDSDFSIAKKFQQYAEYPTYPMLRLRFSTVSNLVRTRDLLQHPFLYGDRPFSFLIHEANIDPIRKFLTAISPDMDTDPEMERQITYCCWARGKGQLVEEGNRISTNELEYKVSCLDIVRIPESECSGWVTYPSAIAIDIECYSNRHKAFPNPHNESHVAYMISCIHQRLETDASTRARYGIIYGDCNHIPEEELANTIIFTVDDEEQLVRMMNAIIVYHNAIVVTGYNTLAFDFPYLWKRIKKFGVKWHNCSMLKNFDCYIMNKTWSSGAYGYNDMNIPVCPGRIFPDVLPIVKMGNVKYSSYSLESVSRALLNKGKHDIKAAEMFVIYEEMVRGIRAGKHTEEYKKAMKKMTEVMRYCIQDSELALDILYEQHWWIGVQEFSSAAGVNIFDLSTGGQQKRCYSLIYHTASKLGYVIDYRASTDLPFAGGKVQDPVVGLHELIMTFDFTSLYPSIMIWKNICYTTYIRDHKNSNISPELYNVTPPILMDKDEDPDASSEEDEDEEEDMKAKSKPTGTKGYYEFAFVKREHQQGILPKVVSGLLAARSVAKKQLAEAKRKGVEKDVLRYDAKQLALKVVANSTYGFMGTGEKGMLPFKEGSVAVTAYGREMIDKVADFLREKHQATIVYGDTDSVMVHSPFVKTREDADRIGKQLAVEITNLFEKPVNMEFEKTYVSVMFIKKKKYAGVLMTDDFLPMMKNGKLDIFLRGVMSARRDNSSWGRDFYNSLLDKILSDSIEKKNKIVSFCESVNFILKEYFEILIGNVDSERLVISRSLGANYKSNSYFMKIFSDELRKEGKPPQPGDRLGYFVMKREGKLGYKMMLDETYYERLGTDQEEKIDYMYYIEKQVQNHIDQVFSIAYRDILYCLEVGFNYYYTPKGRRTSVRFSNIIEFISAILNDGHDINLFVKTLFDLCSTLDEERVKQFANPLG